MQTEPQSLEQQVESLTQRLDALETMLNKRVNLSNLRISHIEHYLGMRKHSFPEGERMWDFNQVSDQVGLSERPKSRFFTREANKRRASA